MDEKLSNQNRSKIVKNQIMSKSMGATVGTLTIAHAKNLKIPLPPLSIQKRIAEILDAADELRQKDKALIEKCHDLFWAFQKNLYA